MSITITTPPGIEQLHHRQLATLLRHYGASKSLSQGKLLHRRLSSILDLHHHPHLSNLLILMYGKCFSLPDAWAVFHHLHHKNTFTWNIMLTTLCSNGQHSQAIHLFHELITTHPISPNHVTFVVALTACTACRDLQSGVQIHAHVSESVFSENPIVCSALITMYGKCGSLGRARSVFDEMPRKGIVAWSAMLAACARNPDQEGLTAAVALYRDLWDAGITPDEYAFISVLEVVGRLGNLQEGKVVHEHVCKIGLEMHPDVAAALVSMYGKSGKPDLAMEMFEKMEEKTVASWNTAIAANSHNGKYKMAIVLLWKMDLEGFRPEMVTLIEVLAACSSCQDMSQGIRIHKRMRECGWQDNVVAGTAIVNLYGKGGEIDQARMFFDRMPKRDVVTWNAMISALSKSGHCQQAIDLYKKMDVKKNSSTFATALSACASLGALDDGRAIHAEIIANFSSFAHPRIDCSVGNAMINMYGQCQRAVEAKKVFDLMKEKNIITWNAMIAAYTHSGHTEEEPLQLFRKLVEQNSSIRPDKVTFVNLFQACSSISSGRELYSQISTSDWSSDPVLINSVMAMFLRCGSPGDARTIFQSFNNRSSVSWTIAIAASAQQGTSDEAVELFLAMIQEGIVPDSYAFVGILSACSHGGLLHAGWSCFSSMRWDYGVEPGAEHYGCLIDLLGRAGRSIQAQELLVAMPFSPDDISWTASLERV